MAFLLAVEQLDCAVFAVVVSVVLAPALGAGKTQKPLKLLQLLRRCARRLICPQSGVGSPVAEAIVLATKIRNLENFDWGTCFYFKKVKIM